MKRALFKTLLVKAQNDKIY